MSEANDKTNTTEFQFSLEEKSFPVTIGGDHYLIVEADSETAQEFHAMVMGGCVLTQAADGNKIERLAGIARSQNYLVSRCLKRLDAMDVRSDVSLATVSKWPHRVTKPLYEKAREISGLREDDATKEEAKNS